VFLGHYGVAFAAKRFAPRTSLGSWVLWAMFILLAEFYAMSLVSPPPPNEHVLAIKTLGLWLFIPWGWWVDRHRESYGFTPSTA
jgi:hypothetical protein